MRHSARESFTRRAAAVALIAILGVAASGCAPVPGVSLEGREFVSVEVQPGPDARPLVPGTVIWLRFGATELGADAGCNTMTGTYRIEGDTLVYTAGQTTTMGCDQPRHEQDAWLVAFLASRPTIELDGDDLTLAGGGTVITLRDREIVEPDAMLVGPTWTLESIIQGDTVASVPAGVEATLVFRADGTLELHAGCNRGGGSWQSAGAAIQFGPLMLTKMACQKDPSSVEGAVLAVLGAGKVGATIDGPMLTLRAGGRGLTYRAG